MAIYGYTKNYKLIKPEYDSDTWHDYEYNNLDVIDAVLSSIFATNNWKGFWDNNTTYAVGDVVADKDQSEMYQVLVAHTTDSNSTFALYREANPTYYREWNANKLAKDWANKTDGVITDIGVSDYSAKAYAIGGTGTETNNSKYYCEQSQAARDVSTQKASEASASASAAATSEANAKSSEDKAKQSELNAKSSETIAKAAQDDPNVVAVGTDLRDTNSTIKAVANDITDVSAVAMIKDEVVTVSSIGGDVSAVSGIKDSVTTVAADKANVDTVATHIGSVDNVSANIQAVKNVNTNMSDVKTVSSNMSDINSISQNIDTVLQAPVDAEKARIFAYGTDAEVQALGGVHSSKGWADEAAAAAQLSDATETTRGVAMLATQSEALAGTNNTKIMTPLKVAQTVTDHVGKGLQLGFNGTLASNVLTFEPDQSAYELKQGYDYEIDLLFPAAGTLPDNTQMVIKNGSDTVQIVNVKHANASTPMTYGNMKQMCRYDADIGWRWIFNARYSVTDTGVKVFVMPSAVINDSQYVTTNTDQTITATKTFTATQAKKSLTADISTTPDAYQANNLILVFDKNNNTMGLLSTGVVPASQTSYSDVGEVRCFMDIRNKDAYIGAVRVSVPIEGTSGAYAACPIYDDAKSPSNAIVTKNKIANMVTTNTNQTISGTKVFTAEQQRKSTTIDLANPPSSYTANNAFGFQDKNGLDMGHLENSIDANGIRTALIAKNKRNHQESMGIFVPNATDDAYAFVPTPPSKTVGEAAVNIDYLNNHYAPFESQRAMFWEHSSTKLFDFDNVTNTITHVSSEVKCYAFDSNTYTKNGTQVSSGYRALSIVGIPSLKTSLAATYGRYNYIFPRIYNGMVADWYAVSLENVDSIYDDTDPDEGRVYFNITTGKIKCRWDNEIFEVGLPIGVLQGKGDSGPYNTFTLSERFDSYGYLCDLVFALPTFINYTPIGAQSNFNMTNFQQSSNGKIVGQFQEADSIVKELWSYQNDEAITNNENIIYSDTAPTSGDGVWFDMKERKQLYCNHWDLAGSTIFNVNGYNFGNFCYTRTPRLIQYRRNSINTYSRHELAQMSMPSNKYINLTLAVTGSSYRAPANGYVSVVLNNVPENGSLDIINGTANNSGVRFISPTGNGVLRGFLPVKKGDVFSVYYNASTTLVRFNFIYADGEQ